MIVATHRVGSVVILLHGLGLLQLRDSLVEGTVLRTLGEVVRHLLRRFIFFPQTLIEVVLHIALLLFIVHMVELMLGLLQLPY